MENVDGKLQVQTNMAIVTYEAVSFKRKQGNTVIDETAFFYLYHPTDKTKDRLIKLEMWKLNDPLKYSAYSVSCIKDSSNIFKFYLHLLKIQSVNYLENTRLLEIKSTVFFDNPKNEFSSKTKEINSNHLTEYRIFFENIPGDSETLVFSPVEKALVKSYEFKSCVLTQNLGFGVGSPPFENCLQILEMAYDKGLYDQDNIEPGIMKIESDSGVAKFFWRDVRKKIENTNKIQNYAMVDIFRIETNPLPNTTRRRWVFVERIYYPFNKMISAIGLNQNDNTPVTDINGSVHPMIFKN
jgi:hypothetical protein